MTHPIITHLVWKDLQDEGADRRSAVTWRSSTPSAKRQAHRIEPYRKLLKVTEETIRYAVQAIERLHRVSGPMAGVAQRLAHELEHYIPLAQQVVSQTRRRVLNAESVHADEKLVSIFEPHTDIIRKDRRDTYYGHKVTLTGGVSGLVLDWVVEQGNPADCSPSFTSYVGASIISANLLILARHLIL